MPLQDLLLGVLLQADFDRHCGEVHPVDGANFVTRKSLFKFLLKQKQRAVLLSPLIRLNNIDNRVKVLNTVYDKVRSDKNRVLKNKMFKINDSVTDTARHIHDKTSSSKSVDSINRTGVKPIKCVGDNDVNSKNAIAKTNNTLIQGKLFTSAVVEQQEPLKIKDSSPLCAKNLENPSQKTKNCQLRNVDELGPKLSLESIKKIQSEFRKFFDRKENMRYYGCHSSHH